MKKLLLGLFGLFVASASYAAIGGGPGGLSYNFVETNGSTVTQRQFLNFTGSGVSVADNVVSTRTDVTITGGATTSTTTLAVSIGSLVISSPTRVLSFNSSQFSGTLTGGTTANISLTSGATFWLQNTNTLQNGATLYVSSGSINGPLSVFRGVLGAFLLPSTTEAFSLVNTSSHQVYMILQSSGTKWWRIGSDVTNLGIPSYDIYNTTTGVKDISISTNDVMSINATASFPSLTASRPVKLNSSKQVTTGLIDVTSDITGTIPSTNLPTNIDYTNVQQTISVNKIFTASQTFNGGIFSSSITDSGLASGQCVQTTTGGLLTVAGAPCGSVGVSLSTNTTGANSFIFNQNTLQVGATFYVSSGTINGALIIGTTLYSNLILPKTIVSTVAIRMEINNSAGINNLRLPLTLYNSFGFTGVQGASGISFDINDDATSGKRHWGEWFVNVGGNNSAGNEYANMYFNMMHAGVMTNVLRMQGCQVGCTPTLSFPVSDSVISMFNDFGGNPQLYPSGNNFVIDPNASAFGENDNLVIGSGRTSTDYGIKFDGALGDGTITWNNSSSSFTVANPWTFSSTMAVNGPLFAGTTGAGTSGKVLTSNGVGVAPTWQTSSGGSGGSSVYPASSTASFPFGFSASTTVYSSSVTFNGIIKSSNTAGGPYSLALYPQSNYPINDQDAGALYIDNTLNNGVGLNIYSNQAAAGGLGNLLRIHADNTSFTQPLVYLIQDGTNGSAANIRMDGPAPQIELVETDQSTPAGKYEWGVNGDIMYFAGRVAADSGFDTFLQLTRKDAAGGGYIAITSTQTPLRFGDADNSNYIAFVAANTILTNNTYVLPSSSGTANQALVTDGSNNLSFSGNTMFISTQDFKDLNSAVISTITATNGVGSLTLPANFFQTGQSVEFYAVGYSSAATSATMNVRVSLGTTTISNTGAKTVNAGLSADTNVPFVVNGILTGRTTGITGTVQGQLTWRMDTNNSSGIADAVVELSGASISATTIDTTSTQILNLSFQWGAASTSNGLVITNYIVKKLGI